MQKYKLLPFEFKRRANGDVLLVNECGDFDILGKDEFSSLVDEQFEK